MLHFWVHAIIDFMSDEELNKKFESQTETIMSGIEQLLNMQKTEILEKVETRISQSENIIFEKVDERIGQAEIKLTDQLVIKEELRAIEDRVAQLEV